MLAVQDIDLRCYGCSLFHVECEGTIPADEDLACFMPSIDIVGEETIQDLECLKIAQGGIMNNRHGTNFCMKIAQVEPSGNDPWLITLQKASGLLESTARALASGGHTFFTAQVKGIRDEINEQIQGEKEWLRKE